MPAWATVAITLGASAIAVAGTLAGTILQQRFARREREAAEAAEWVKEGAAILGPIQSLLTDSDPRRVTMNLNPQTRPAMQDLRVQRWERQLRDRLATFAAGHPHGGVREKATELGVALHNSLITTSWLVGDMLDSKDRSELGRARAEHDLAAERAKELAELIRRYGGQRGGNRSHRDRTRRRVQRWRRKARRSGDSSA
jgi:hypothetical protein